MSRNESVHDFERKIKTLEDNIELLQKKMNKAAKDKTEGYKEEMEKLLEKKIQLKDKFAKLRKSSQNTWDKLSSNFEDQLSTLSTSLANLQKKLEV